jgi:glutamine synthetase
MAATTAPISFAFRPAGGSRCGSPTAPPIPYLLQAAILAAGLDGIANKTDPGKRLDIHMFEEGQKLNDIRRLPANLLDALRLFDKAKLMRGKLGAPFVSAYVKLKLMEWDAYCAAFSEWERTNTLDC